jgi:hypothetical protein
VKNLKIISGGQSGVDRAALDFCLNRKIDCGGWCPADRKAEDGRIPERYPLTETKSSDYAERTRLNIENSDGTIILHCGKTDTGTILTITIVIEVNKPFLNINLKDNYDPDMIIKWIDDHRIKTLNIAGPRESNQPGIYQLTTEFLKKVF